METSPWISVDDDLPELDTWVITCDSISNIITLGKVYLEEGICGFENVKIGPVEADSFPTHWMPLPEPPKD